MNVSVDSDSLPILSHMRPAGRVMEEKDVSLLTYWFEGLAVMEMLCIL